MEKKLEQLLKALEERAEGLWNKTIEEKQDWQNDEDYERLKAKNQGRLAELSRTIELIKDSLK